VTEELHPDRVPGAESATTDERKFTEYLLNRNHLLGSGKAKFFKQIGFDQRNWQELRDQFLAQLPYVEGRYMRDNPGGGANYLAAMNIEGSDRTVEVKTFWEVHPVTGTRFLTAYPLE
jgi:uncharacterized protein DUF6883